jgi:hypothetical protein
MDLRSGAEPVVPEPPEFIGAGERRKLRERTVAAALERKLESGKAVAGLIDVLKVFNAGTLRRVIVRDGFAKMGRLCLWCQRPSLYETRCPGCWRRTEAVLDVVDTLLKLARMHGCRVVRMRHEPLDEAQRICGELERQP